MEFGSRHHAAADVEITGAYTPIVYTVTWKIDGEQGTYKQTQATFGEAIATPEAPIEKEATPSSGEVFPRPCPQTRISSLPATM